MKSSLGLRRGHTANVEAMIDTIGGLYDGFKHVEKRIREDRNLSEHGKRSKISEFMKNEVLRNMAGASSSMRKALRSIEEQRRGLREMSQPAAVDALENARRAEIRTFLRSLPSEERIRVAQSDPRFYEAAFDAPAALSGLPAPMLETLKAERDEARIQQDHGPKLRELEYEERDYQVVQQVESYYLKQLRVDAEISPQDMQGVWQPLTAAADNPGS
ncbi:hypothetical protein [Methylobacterium radiotolerans]|uniref:hypothetical protein n=1 Tax=Methylobacterium radiotolerans TaxID=31998 RepID=UPI0015F760D8|nr:hypothetical protein [Methylobacterium radiotolerans]